MHDISSQQSCLLDPSVVSKTCHFPPTFSSWSQGVYVVWILPNRQLYILCVCLEPKEVGFTQVLDLQASNSDHWEAGARWDSRPILLGKHLVREKWRGSRDDLGDPSDWNAILNLIEEVGGCGREERLDRNVLESKEVPCSLKKELQGHRGVLWPRSAVSCLLDSWEQVCQGPFLRHWWEQLISMASPQTLPWTSKFSSWNHWSVMLPMLSGLQAYLHGCLS